MDGVYLMGREMLGAPGAGGCREGQAVPSLLGSSDRLEEKEKERNGQLTSTRRGEWWLGE